MIRPLRALVAFVALVTVGVGAALGAAAVAPVEAAHASGGSTAVVVIDTGANVRSAVIHFDGSITGIEALELAGANPATYGFQGQGAAVCALDGVGNPADQSCLVGPNSEYWAYYVARGGASSWTYSRGCACTTMVGDGDVEGWRYGTGAAPRGSASFCSYVDCPAPAPPAGGGGSGDSGGGGGGSGDGGGGSGSGGSAPPAGFAPPGDSAPASGGGGGGAGGSGPAGASPAAGGGSSPTASGNAGGGLPELPTGRATPATPGTEGAVPTGDVAASSTTAAPTTTRPRGGSGGGNGGSGDRELGALAASQRRAGGGDGDSGSPTGVAIAAVVLAAAAAGAVIVRRRRIRSSTSG